MRVLSLALVLLYVSSSALLMNSQQASAQTSLVPTAKSDIVAAFQAIRQAEQRGASNTDILPLIIILNQALQFEENATLLEQKNDTTDAGSAALQSITLSTNVASQAQQLASDSQAASQRRTIVSYGSAIAIAVVAAFIVMIVPDTTRLIRKKRMRKARIVYEETTNAK